MTASKRRMTDLFWYRVSVWDGRPLRRSTEGAIDERWSQEGPIVDVGRTVSKSLLSIAVRWIDRALYVRNGA